MGCYTLQTHSCAQLMNAHIESPLTLSVHMSTHLSTDMFWMTALKGSANEMLSGRWKHPLKMALPSETDRTSQNVIHQHKKNSIHQVGPCPLTPDEEIPLGLSQSLMRL